MICWGKVEPICGRERSESLQAKSRAQRGNLGKFAEIVATAVLIFGSAYLLGHIIAAWLRGSFEVIAR